LLQWVKECEAYVIIDCLLQFNGQKAHPNGAWYLPQNKTRTALMAEGFRLAVDKWVTDVSKHFKAQTLDAADMSSLWFNRLFSGCLTPQVVVRVLDCYFHEGNKILYRTALALLRGNARALKSVGTPEHLLEVAMDITRSSTDPEKLLKAGFSIKRLPKKLLEKQQKKTSGTLFASAETRSFYLPTVTGAPADSLLNPSNVLTIWGWLPPRQKICDAALLFDSNKSGFSIKTFLNLADFSGPNLVFIETSSGVVAGGFASSSWKISRDPLGTGECFVFSLQPGEPRSYPWVPGSNEMFMMCDGKGITFGGGSAFALHLNETLTEATSGRSETFNNEPLFGGDDHASVVRVMVFGISQE